MNRNILILLCIMSLLILQGCATRKSVLSEDAINANNEILSLEGEKKDLAGQAPFRVGKSQIQYLSCVDSDNGMNISSKGTVNVEYTISNTKKSLNVQDICRDGKLIEYYCSNKQLYKNVSSCQKICKDGVCTEEAILPVAAVPNVTGVWSGQCFDSDGGKNYGKGGYATVTNGTIKQVDVCIYNSNSNKYELSEQYCFNGTIITEIRVCDYGCDNNTCAQESGCSDSDLGRDYFSVGTATGFTQKGQRQKYVNVSDFCDKPNPNIVWEWFCDENKWLNFEAYECSYGCLAGKCVSCDNLAWSVKGSVVYAYNPLFNSSYSQTFKGFNDGDFLLDFIPEYFDEDNNTWVDINFSTIKDVSKIVVTSGNPSQCPDMYEILAHQNNNYVSLAVVNGTIKGIHAFPTIQTDSIRLLLHGRFFALIEIEAYSKDTCAHYGCVDSDADNNEFIKGNVTAGAKTQMHFDYCKEESDGNYSIEVSCTLGSIIHIYKKCPGLCVDGACLAGP